MRIQRPRRRSHHQQSHRGSQPWAKVPLVLPGQIARLHEVCIERTVLVLVHVLRLLRAKGCRLQPEWVIGPYQQQPLR